MSGVLVDLSELEPCGPNVEFDADYGELERAAQGKTEQQYGDTIIAAAEPAWKDVAAQATALCQRTYDLRVMVHLATARLQIGGIAPFGEVIAQIRSLLAERWATVHPQLDPEDDNDPTLRANALLPLIHPTRIIRVLRDMPLATLRGEGTISLRTIYILLGSIEPELDSERKTEAAIRAAFAASGRPALLERQALIDTCAADLAGIGRAFDSQSGYGNAPDLTPLAKLLADLSRFITQYLPQADDAPAEDEPVTSDEPETASPSEPAPRARGAVTAASLTAVTSRADAVRLLDLVCRYYETYEPSSPLPLLIGRARRLADKSFLEILQDLAPDGLMQAQTIVQSREN